MDDTDDLIRTALRREADRIVIAARGARQQSDRSPTGRVRQWLTVAAACVLAASVAVTVAVFVRHRLDASAAPAPLAADSPLADCVDPHPPLPPAVVGPASASFAGSSLRRSLVLDGGQFRADPVPAGTRAISRSVALCNALAGLSANNFPLSGEASQAGMSFALGRVTIADRIVHAPVPRWRGRLAWLAVFAPLVKTSSCPHFAPSSVSTPPSPQAANPGYQIMVIDAASGTEAVLYVAQAPAPCAGMQGEPASVSRGRESVSVPWTLVSRGPGPKAALIAYRGRPCDSARDLGRFGVGGPPAVLADRDVPGRVEVALSRTMTRCGPPRATTLLLRSATLATDLPTRLIHAPVGALDVIR